VEGKDSDSSSDFFKELMTGNNSFFKQMTFKQ